MSSDVVKMMSPAACVSCCLKPVALDTFSVSHFTHLGACLADELKLAANQLAADRAERRNETHSISNNVIITYKPRVEQSNET